LVVAPVQVGVGATRVSLQPISWITRRQRKQLSKKQTIPAKTVKLVQFCVNRAITA
jgi:hypothetical protein